MDGLSLFGLFAVSAMLVFYALEHRSRWFVLAFAGACALGSLYGFLQGAWPFGIVEAIWCVVAGRRWWLKRGSRMKSTATENQPIACTLIEGDFRDRLAWIAELTRDALRSYERADLTLKLRYDPESVQRVQEMIRKERACCAFLTFEIREQADEVWLTIKAPEDARTTAEALFEPFLPRKPEE